MREFSCVTRSATGLVRGNNEDAVHVDPVRGVFAVADGMGGGDEGERASRMVCAALARGVTAERFSVRLDETARAIAAANRSIFTFARENRLRQMGSTVALLALDPAEVSRAAIAYVGDSRVYRVRGGTAELLTRDHSVGAELEAKIGHALGGRFSERSNPLAHVLTRAVGTSEKVEIEWRKIDAAPDDRFLVCTDGVHDVLKTADLSDLIVSQPLERAAERIEEAILDAGAPDNYSFVLIES